MILRFTETEGQIIHHRLSVPDALADALDEYHPEDVTYIADLMRQELERNKMRFLDTRSYEQYNTSLFKEILADCIEGSTWIGTMEGNCSEQQIQSHLRAYENVAGKIETLIGRKLQLAG